MEGGDIKSKAAQLLDELEKAKDNFFGIDHCELCNEYIILLNSICDKWTHFKSTGGKNV